MGRIEKFIVPYDGNLTITAAGASGGTYHNLGGKGGVISAIFQVTTGQELFVSVGQAGISPGYCNVGLETVGGGGGSNCGGGPGGGASDVRLVSNDLTSRIIVAGGGGGGSYATSGACGGGLVGCSMGCSMGGNQTHGGVCLSIATLDDWNCPLTHYGSFGYGGTGYFQVCCGSAGGGGGGYYGGAGGFGDQGGAGGSSYCDSSGTVISNRQGINQGNGYINMVLVATSTPTYLPTMVPHVKQAAIPSKIPTKLLLRSMTPTSYPNINAPTDHIESLMSSSVNGSVSTNAIIGISVGIIGVICLLMILFRYFTQYEYNKDRHSVAGMQNVSRASTDSNRGSIIMVNGIRKICFSDNIGISGSDSTAEALTAPYIDWRDIQIMGNRLENAVIGQGSYGRVVLAKVHMNPENSCLVIPEEHVVIKIIDKSLVPMYDTKSHHKNLSIAMNEVKILLDTESKIINKECIIKVYGTGMATGNLPVNLCSFFNVADYTHAIEKGGSF